MVYSLHTLSSIKAQYERLGLSQAPIRVAQYIHFKFCIKSMPIRLDLELVRCHIGS